MDWTPGTQFRAPSRAAVVFFEGYPNALDSVSECH
jgi:hypothetical protein